jgi:hypothetical protein
MIIGDTALVASIRHTFSRLLGHNMKRRGGFSRRRGVCGDLERMSCSVFAICCVLVITISVHDALLVVLHRNTIDQFEKNPLGKWLL